MHIFMNLINYFGNDILVTVLLLFTYDLLLPMYEAQYLLQQ